MPEIYRNKKDKSFWENLGNDGRIDEKPVEQSPEEVYKSMLKKPEYGTIRTGIGRMERTLALIESSWQKSNKKQVLTELGYVLERQQIIEKEIEQIREPLLREYVYGKIDEIAAIRRSLSEEIKWYLESEKKICNGVETSTALEPVHVKMTEGFYVKGLEPLTDYAWTT